MTVLIVLARMLVGLLVIVGVETRVALAFYFGWV
jgi:hypothetical protein